LPRPGRRLLLRGLLLGDDVASHSLLLLFGVGSGLLRLRGVGGGLLLRDARGLRAPSRPWPRHPWTQLLELDPELVALLAAMSKPTMLSTTFWCGALEAPKSPRLLRFDHRRERGEDALAALLRVVHDGRVGRRLHLRGHLVLGHRADLLAPRAMHSLGTCVGTPARNSMVWPTFVATTLSTGIVNFMVFLLSWGTDTTRGLSAPCH
jgi:hypothetical protein